MANGTLRPQLNWASFESCNPDPRTAFELLCRSLFNRFFFGNKALFHSNPNNPGTEIEPLFETEQGSLISFQAKYFSSVIDYSQIEHSIDTTISHYAGKINTLYLYCNRDVTTTSAIYTRIEKKLSAYQITLIPITNQTILDQTMDYPVVSFYYFNRQILTQEWFDEHLIVSLDRMGPRYNSHLNIATKTEEYMDLFSQNDDAIKAINAKKTAAIDELAEKRKRYKKYYSFIEKAITTIRTLDDVTSTTIDQCIDWAEIIRQALQTEIRDVESIACIKRETIQQEEDRKKRQEIRQEILELEYLLDIPLLLELTETERHILQRKVLIVEGEAGVGKSQLFAKSAEKRIRTGGNSLLLLGWTYLTDDPVIQQIMTGLNIYNCIDELLWTLEIIGEQKQQCVIIYIDAINESANKNIWKTGFLPLCAKLNNLNHVRLAVSVRSGYQSLCFDDATESKIEHGEIVCISHVGFQDDPIAATKTFLNFYGIPFSPSYVLQHEMTNPLFLTLFCQVYNGEEIDIFSVFERIINKADGEVQDVLGLGKSTLLLKELIYDIAEYQLTNKRRTIEKQALFGLEFWARYGLLTCKTQFVAVVERAGILLSFARDDTEWYSLGYELLGDFACAKSVIKKHPDKNELEEYLKSDFLDNGSAIEQKTIDIFIIVCSLYAERYREECIEIVDGLDFDEDVKNQFYERYVESFLWRKSQVADGDEFISFVNTHPVTARAVFRVFIENSTKSIHPLNAELLHSVLLKFTLSKRDYLWTTFINRFDADEERLYQLVALLEKGEELSGITNRNLWLLLILFSWILTSSNRFLRDKTSKAMVVLLKDHFEMCKPLLEAFENVNDPYIIQRLFGVVFGACVKRTAEQEAIFNELSTYIYQTIFGKDTVYPDILLRDYARLILERWLFEFPTGKEVIDCRKIIPPYHSAEIPVVKQEEYFERNTRSGFVYIDISMRPNCVGIPGMYGDFGRYVFQAALDDFDGVDIANLYHYAMQYIRDTLGYSDELFADYDASAGAAYYSRHQTKKVERIGKKYQWIAFYNILARISDQHSLKDWDDRLHAYEGAWEPYVRDFDPTRNSASRQLKDLVKLELPHIVPEFIDTDVDDPSIITRWTNAGCPLFSEHSARLVLVDSQGQEWIKLNQYEELKDEPISYDYDSVDIAAGTQSIWSMSHGYFIKEDEFDHFKSVIGTRAFTGRWLPEAIAVYQLFCREYAWAPSCQSIIGDPWQDCEVETGARTVIKHTVPMVKLQILPTDENGEDIEDELLLNPNGDEVIVEKVSIARIMPSYCQIRWEEQYDASEEDTIDFDAPCKEIMEYFQLEQKNEDGYFYNREGVLVAFDGELLNFGAGLLIKKDYLEKFLFDKGLRLFWACIGEKQFFHGYSKQTWSSWSGFFYLDGGKIIGNMEKKE